MHGDDPPCLPFPLPLVLCSRLPPRVFLCPLPRMLFGYPFLVSIVPPIVFIVDHHCLHCLYRYSPAVAQCWCHGIVVYVVFNSYLRLIIVFIVSPIVFIVVQTSALSRRASSCHWLYPRRTRRVPQPLAFNL